MKQDVLMIHGGNVFETYEAYISYLKSRGVSREKMKPRGWRMTLGERMGDNFDVLIPDMPNKQNAKYAEWKIWFERIIPLINSNAILVGHSLGGIFLTKYLSEELFPKPIKATVLIAAPYGTKSDPFHTEEDPSLVDFDLPDNLDLLAKQGGSLFFFQSKDDQVVPFSSVEHYQRLLPSAKVNMFEDRGHFEQAQLPELESLLRTLV